MFLRKAIFVNWGNIPLLETAFEFGPVNLFSGGNGSGKTTAADAIQTLMTAAHENLFNYNPGQDETTQRGRGGKQVRTLASYVLGCDDGSYARPHATDGYVAGVFHPTQGELGEPFTAVMCIRAHLDNAGKQRQARLDDLIFLILPGEQLEQSHFIRRYPDGRHVIPVTDIVNLLKKEFGNKTVEVYDKKGAYLRRLYAVLRGRKDAVSDREAKHAARTFSNFMAYKPVKSINDFVAHEILEPKDLGDAIKNVSELMKTIHQMEEDTRKVKESIAQLDDARQQSQRYIHTWIERHIADFTEATRRARENHKHYLAAKTEQQSARDTVLDNQTKLHICEQRKTQLHDEIVSLEAQRQGISALKDKDALEKTIADNNRQLVEQARPLYEQDQQLSRNSRACEQLLHALSESSVAVDIPALDGRELRQLAKKLSTAGDNSGIDLTQLLGNDWIDIAPLENQLDAMLETEASHRKMAELLHQSDAKTNAASIRDQLSHLLSKAHVRSQELASRRRQKQKEIQLLESQKVSYPSYVETALAAIRKECPAADPQVLCDYIEVLDPNWQMAIEGYIGGARFSIIVEPDYEADAIRIVRKLADSRRNRARIIQGSKARRDAEKLSLSAQSIISVISFSHKTAEYYLRASYGNVLRVDDADALRNTARGITPDGLGCGNYSMWRCDLDDSELVFGQGARERALQAKQKEFQQISIDTNNAELDSQKIARIFELAEDIKPVSCTTIVRQMLAMHRTIQAAESALARLDLSDYQALEQQLEQHKTAYQGQEIQQRELVSNIGRHEERERQCAKKVKELADAMEALQLAQEDTEAAIEKIADWVVGFDAEKAITEAEQRAIQASTDFNFEEEVHDLSERLDRTERDIYQTLLAHNQGCQPHDAIVYDTGLCDRHSPEFFQHLVKLGDQIALIYNRLKNNVLVEKYDKLSALRDTFNTVFITNLCHSIYQAINDGKRILEDLNRELEHHYFGADRERFRFGYQWVPEYQDYWQFFKEVIAVPNLGDGASLFDTELSARACLVRDRMRAMLLERDEQMALRELSRISDYRNYRQYEIFKEPEGKAPIPLSQYGTGSGGQLETPAYIIRSAAITSAFRFNEGNTHLRMVLVDEAFSKMDETRSREVIHYLTDTLGLQLVFIMPTSKSGPFMDLISNQFVFSKCPANTPTGELNTRVLVDRKRCNQQKIKQLWANHRKMVRQQGMLDFMEGL